MDRQVPNDKRQRETTVGEWPKMPGQFPGVCFIPPLVQTNIIKWSDVRQAANISKPPISPTIDPEVQGFWKWIEGINASLAEIHRKLDFLLSAHVRATLSEEWKRTTRIYRRALRWAPIWPTLATVSISISKPLRILCRSWLPRRSKLMI
ncbi:hypothetical protein CORC01_09520 [Colletotrichum orchidophilum]|uniref:Uncharacterized protein n=1 Tax=Colletotrichum orchidophilum TaxID=1209926 RepID=A0A1G4B1B7_9PEZI|nr:uncharacterized protein CORC01_09520 [Colletotrichum orchidophilum]OHE95133.1 hypothetical protein CORC01_09520 [Colletotrichum orchidophilum]